MDFVNASTVSLTSFIATYEKYLIDLESVEATVLCQDALGGGARAAQWHASHLDALCDRYASTRTPCQEGSASLQVAIRQLAADFRCRAERLLTVMRRVQRRYSSLRRDVRLDRFTADDFRAEIQSHPAATATTLLVNGLFNTGEERAKALRSRIHFQEYECVQYVPTSATAALQLEARLNLSPRDTLFELGCGLGKVALLIGWLSGATTYGVDYQKAYCQAAARTAKSMGLSNVHFIHADARTVDCSAGTAFYLFDPFRGSILERVIDRMRRVALDRCIVIAAAGRCVYALRAQAWLREDAGGPLDPLHDWSPTIFRAIGVRTSKSSSDGAPFQRSVERP